MKKAIRLPIFVRYNTNVGSLNGSVVLGGISRQHIGFGSVGIFDKKYQGSMMEIDEKKELPDGHVGLGQGSRLSVGRDAILSFGRHFHNSVGMAIVCTKNITLGDNVGVSWDTLTMDSDWHPLVSTVTEEMKPYQKDIFIGDNVWIDCGCKILKGSCIANSCVIGAGTVVSGRFAAANFIIVGQSAKVVKK